MKCNSQTFFLPHIKQGEQQSSSSSFWIFFISPFIKERKLLELGILVLDPLMSNFLCQNRTKTYLNLLNLVPIIFFISENLTEIQPLTKI